MSDPFVGEIHMFAGNFAPRGYAFCEGQLIQISQNVELFSLLGTIYGGDGYTTFALPDMRGRIPLHAGSGPGLSYRTLGQMGGAESVTIDTNHMASHTHKLQAANTTPNQSAPEGKVLSQTTPKVYATTTPTADMNPGAIEVTGGNQRHDNMMPYLCVNFIIALQGAYPSRT